MGEVENFIKNPIGKIGDALGLNPAGPNLGAYGATPQEQEFLNQLILRSKGMAGPSPAQMQLNAGLDQANANAVSVAAANRGVSPALAARQAQEAQQQNTMATNQQAGVLRAQEQFGTDQLLSSVFNANRNARIGAANAEYQAGADTANRNAGLIGSLGGALLTGGLKKAHGGYINEGPEIVPGDSEVNDVVPVMASKGEIVIPKSKASDPEKAKEFIDQLMKGKGKKEEKFDFAKLMKTQREILERIKSLEGEEKEAG